MVTAARAKQHEPHKWRQGREPPNPINPCPVRRANVFSREPIEHRFHLRHFACGQQTGSPDGFVANVPLIVQFRADALSHDGFFPASVSKFDDNVYDPFSDWTANRCTAKSRVSSNHTSTSSTLTLSPFSLTYSL